MKVFTMILTPLAILMVSTHDLYGQTRIVQVHQYKQQTFRDSNRLEGNLLHLNLCGERPEHVQEIYKTAFNTLNAHPNAGFIELAGNQAFLDLCRENGITHSGGPMLGNISSEGASVWIRTLKPATVEVRIDAHGVTRTF